MTSLPPFLAARYRFATTHEIRSWSFGVVRSRRTPDTTDWRAELRHEQAFKSTSAVAFDEMPAEAIGVLRDALENSPRKPGEKTWFEEDYINARKIKDRELFS